MYSHASKQVLDATGKAEGSAARPAGFCLLQEPMHAAAVYNEVVSGETRWRIFLLTGDFTDGALEQWAPGEEPRSDFSVCCFVGSDKAAWYILGPAIPGKWWISQQHYEELNAKMQHPAYNIWDVYEGPCPVTIPPQSPFTMDN